MGIKLEVGKTYLDRTGRQVKIVKHLSYGGSYEYFGDDGDSYTVDGFWQICVAPSARDLVAEANVGGVTHDGEPQSVHMTEDDYKALAYQRYNCIDERTGQVTEVVLGAARPMSKAEYYAFVQDTFESLLALIKRKNADYTAGADDAFANFRRAEPVVPMLQATWVRWGDKIQRVDAFFRNGKLEVANEGLEDALLDVIGYSMIMLGELKEKGNA